jgi:digeranylgeranylglycerophospholipid reductase
VRADVLVVGGGPAGSTAAARLARGHDVVIAEEHGLPGEPLQCAGLVTPRGVPGYAKESVLASVRGARIHSPLGFTLTIESREPRALVLDRKRFDRMAFERAVDAGAKAVTGARITGVDESRSSAVASMRVGGATRPVEASVVIGADGHRSVCRESARFRAPKHMLRGLQVDLKGVKRDPEFVDLFLGWKVAPGFFAWSIPAGDVTRVGLCTWGEEHTPITFLKKLLKRPEFADAAETSRASGRIPIGPGRSAVRGRIALVGDAACHAKPLSGGGVYTGMKGAEICSDVVRDHLADPLKNRLSAYDDLWWDAFGQELAGAFRIRKIFLALTDRKMDSALRLFDEPDVRRLIEERGDIDRPSALSPDVLKLAPKLAQFSPQLIKSLL